MSRLRSFLVLSIYRDARIQQIQNPIQILCLLLLKLLVSTTFWLSLRLGLVGLWRTKALTTLRHHLWVKLSQNICLRNDFISMSINIYSLQLVSALGMNMFFTEVIPNISISETCFFLF